jgi:hypothetical protein
VLLSLASSNLADTYSYFPTGTPTLPPPTTSPTECDGVFFTVTLLTDFYGSEVSWILTKDGLTILSSVGETPYGSFQQYVSSTCFPAECHGDYTFSIFDSDGDGMSDGTPGSYLVTLDGVTKAEGGGDYGFDDITEFSGNCSPPPTPPTPVPTPNPTTLPTECAGVYLTVTLITDQFGYEVSWNVTEDGFAILSSDGETYGNNLQYVSSTCVPAECDGNYTFSIFDSYGDGLGWGEPGSYTVTLGGVVKAQGGGNYGSEEIKDFSGCDDKVNGIDHDVQSLTYNSLNFGPSGTTKSVQLRYAKGDNGGKLELRIGGPTGTLIAEYSPAMTRNWDTFTTVNIDIDDVIGIQDLTLVVKGVSTVMNIDWFELSA